VNIEREFRGFALTPGTGAKRNRISRIIQEKKAQEILAHFLAQNSADYAQMMPFYPTNAAVNR
jgi:hypothetical protein